MKTIVTSAHVRLTLVVLFVALLVPATGVAFAAGPAKVDLGDTESFAILSGSNSTTPSTRSVGNTGTSTITGDVGVWPDGSITGFGTVTLNGAQHLNDAAAEAAQTSLAAAYADAAGRTPATIANALGGVTLTTGVYTPVQGGFLIDGTLTLDGQGDPDAVFIFQCTSLDAVSDSTVKLINGARFCRVFWQVVGNARAGVTIDSGAEFEGHVFTQGAIMVSGATVHGQLLSVNGPVELNASTITQIACADMPSPPPTIPPKAVIASHSAPKLPATGYAPEKHDRSWLPMALALAAGTALLFAAWRLGSSTR